MTHPISFCPSTTYEKSIVVLHIITLHYFLIFVNSFITNYLPQNFMLRTANSFLQLFILSNLVVIIRHLSIVNLLHLLYYMFVLCLVHLKKGCVVYNYANNYEDSYISSTDVNFFDFNSYIIQQKEIGCTHTPYFFLSSRILCE